MANQNSHRPFRELPRHYPLLFSVIVLVVSFGVALFVKWFEHGWPLTSPQGAEDLALNTFFGFAIGQLAFVLLQMLVVEDKLDKLAVQVDSTFTDLAADLENKERRIGQIALRNQDQHDANLNIFRMFYSRGNPAHDALRLSLLQLVRNMHFSDHHLKFDSEYLSRGSFENFWRFLIEEQKRRRKENLPDLVVRAAHSASVRLWDNNQFFPMLTLQEELIKNGGKIFRVLLHNPNSSERPEDYLTSLEAMRSIDIKAFYLDKRNLANEPPHDFVLARLDRTLYAFSWKTDWNEHGSQGDILGTEIAFGREEVDVYWHQWLRDMHRLKVKARAVSDSRDHGDPLSVVPTPGEMAIMEALAE